MSRKELSRLAERFAQPEAKDLEDALKALGMTQAGLAREFKVSPAFISKVKAGQKRLPPEHSETIANLLRKAAKRA